MKQKAIYCLLFLILAGVLFSAIPAYAAVTLAAPTWKGIVPCGRYSEGIDDSGNWQAAGEDISKTCTLCHLIVGIDRIIQYGQWILITVGVVAIFIAGIIYIISSGNPGLMEKAKKFLTAALIGFTVVLASWLIINVLITWVMNAKPGLGIENTIDSSGAIVWNDFTCSTESVSGGPTSGGSGTPGGTTVKKCTEYKFTCVTGSTCPGTDQEKKTGYTCDNSGDICCGAKSVAGQCEDGGPKATTGMICAGSGSCPDSLSDCNTSDYDDIIQSVANPSGYPEITAKVIKGFICRESRGKPGETNDVGVGVSCGLMQINRSSVEVCQQQNLFDPETNIRAGVNLLKVKISDARTKKRDNNYTRVTLGEMTAAGYNCCSGGDKPNNPSASCPEAEWGKIPKWACPIDPGEKEFNMCAVKRYACNVGACF